MTNKYARIYDSLNVENYVCKPYGIILWHEYDNTWVTLEWYVNNTERNRKLAELIQHESDLNRIELNHGRFK